MHCLHILGVLGSERSTARLTLAILLRKCKWNCCPAAADAAPWDATTGRPDSGYQEHSKADPAYYPCESAEPRDAGPVIKPIPSRKHRAGGVALALKRSAFAGLCFPSHAMKPHRRWGRP